MMVAQGSSFTRKLRTQVRIHSAYTLRSTYYAEDTLALNLFESKFIATLPTKITVPTITTSGPTGTFT